MQKPKHVVLRHPQSVGTNKHHQSPLPVLEIGLAVVLCSCGSLFLRVQQQRLRCVADVAVGGRGFGWLAI